MTTDATTQEAGRNAKAAVASSEWLSADSNKPAVSGDGVASQRSRGRDECRIFRVWDMPHPHTFTIPTVRSILRRFVGNGWGWADPFANAHSPAEHTNDINPDMPTKYNMDAVAFLRLFGSGELNGVLLDPPYSMHQIVECYEGYGGKRVKAMRAVYDETARVVKCGGIVISFGWNSNGVGASRGFNLLEVVLIPHGGSHNDTIITVEAKAEQTAELFPSVADTQPTVAACARGSRSETEQADNHRI